MTSTKTLFSILSTVALTLSLAGFVYTANGQEAELSPQEQFKQLEAISKVQKAEFEARQLKQKESLTERQSEMQKNMLDTKKYEMQKTSHAIWQRAEITKEQFDALTEAEKQALHEKFQTIKKEETAERIQKRKAVLQKRHKERIKNLAANISNRMEAVIIRLENIIHRFEKRMNILASRGVDITVAKESLTKAAGHLNEAKRLISGIDMTIAKVIESESPREAWQNAKKQYFEIKKHIKEAHALIRTSLQQLKQAVAETQNPNRGGDAQDKPDTQEAPIN